VRLLDLAESKDHRGMGGLMANNRQTLPPQAKEPGAKLDGPCFNNIAGKSCA